MMDTHLNFFQSWERIPANHENQLTRALLVVLRYCPMAHQAWLSLVDPKKRGLHSLDQPTTFRTQKATILSGERLGPPDERIEVISVLCAADIANDGSRTGVRESGRGQILDGIIQYGEQLAIV